MSSPQTAAPNPRFNSRLNRVADRNAPVEAAKAPVDVLPDWRENAHGPAGIVMAVLVGLAAVVLVRLARFHFLEVALVSNSPDITLAIECTAALALSFTIFLFLPWSGAKYGFLQFAGVAVMALTMHNMVHNAPGLFNLAFSPAWTEEVIAETKPSSMYLLGHSIPFSGKIRGEEVVEEAPAPVEPEEPELPRRIVIGQ